jgi:hypothetical protein
MWATVLADLTDTSFAIQHSILDAASMWNYSLEFWFATVPVAAGQIAWNDINGEQTVDVDYVTAGTIPLGNNYWRNKLPSVRLQFTGPQVGVDFAPVLDAPPVGVGPSW